MFLFLSAIETLEARQQVKDLHCHALAASGDSKAINKAIATINKELGQN